MPKMPFKDYAPIKFEFFQSDMEKIMLFLDWVVQESGKIRIVDTANSIKADLQNKIEEHIDRGEWK